MSASRRPLLAAAAAATALAAPLVLLAAHTAAAQEPVEPTPPSIAQLCAATGVAEVDALLADLSRSQLPLELSPLVSLLVPDTDTPELDASVQLDDVRAALNCAPTTTPPATTPPTGEPTTTPTGTPLPDVDDDRDGDGDGFEQVGRVPVGAADTGGGPAR